MSDIEDSPTQGMQESSHERMPRHRFHTNAAVVLTGLFMVALAVISMLASSNDEESYLQYQRLLDENGDDNNDEPYDDFSSYSCNQIYSMTSSDNMDQRCAFAKTCNGGDGLFAPVVFCKTSRMSTMHWFLVLSPFLTIWLVLLFRMLGSTAEDYFSPSLEMFSLKLGLPPRFAGVTLLALGNGAADVSATVNAIVSDPQNGYHISLGALTGAGMFVGCVVAGIVIVLADGVRCRGALVRDVCALLVTVIVVSSVLAHGSIGPSAVSLFITMYLVFVVIVLIADIYHRAVVLPRIQREIELEERQRQLEEQQRVSGQAGAALDALAAGETQAEGTATTSPLDVGVEETCPNPVNRAINSVLGALSNYDNGRDVTQGGASRTAGGWGVESDDILHERPVVLHGANGLLNKHHHTPTRNEADDPEVTSPYTAIMDEGLDGLDRVCTEPESHGYTSHNWVGAWQDGKQELYAHAEEVWEDIFLTEENTALDKLLLVCELPFTFLRKVTVPIPCEGYYCRALVALSVFISPVWFAFYLWMEHGVNLFWWHGVSYMALLFVPSTIVGALVLRYAPGGGGNMALLVSAPIAFYGFIIAATWIDCIADHLVNLLDFLGIIFKIPGSIMGMTILAWGNSMGDLSANMTMARKGLANMAMTACFAGPVFNILIGLGLGFSALSAQTGESEATVSMSPSVVTGMIFIILNTAMILFAGVVLGRGAIPKTYGYAAVALYMAYVATSFLVPSS